MSCSACSGLSVLQCTSAPSACARKECGVEERRSRGERDGREMSLGLGVLDLGSWTLNLGSRVLLSGCCVLAILMFWCFVLVSGLMSSCVVVWLCACVVVCWCGCVLVCWCAGVWARCYQFGATSADRGRSFRTCKPIDDAFDKASRKIEERSSSMSDAPSVCIHLHFHLPAAHPHTFLSTYQCVCFMLKLDA